MQIKYLRRRKKGDAAFRRAGIGNAPGTILADPMALETKLYFMGYGRGAFEEREGTIEDLKALRETHAVVWVDVVGLGDQETVAKVGEFLGLHALALEDVMNLGQRPKVEDYGDHLFVVTRIVEPAEELVPEQISLFVGGDFVVTFQEKSGDCFDRIRERLRQGRSRICERGSDYLAYSLLDAVIDHLVPVVDRYGEKLEALEDRLFSGEKTNFVLETMGIRRDLQLLRRIATPMRDAMIGLMSDDLPVIGDETRLYLRDCHDHAVRLLEDVESWREFESSLMNVHLSVSGQQLNATMKVLTMIATIFIPLNFLAALYGMNFDPSASRYNMPELAWAYGYPALLFLMFCIFVAQLLFFRKKGWLG